MLYDARHEWVLKEGYQVKYVSVHQPGHNVKYVPVYRSPSGDEVFEDEATVERIAIVEVPDIAPSRSERERAINKLSGILVAKPSPNVDWPQLKQAIEAMALEADLKFKVGQYMAERLPSENPDAEYAVRLLVESGLKEAIAPLTELLVYEASWDHRGDEDSVHNLALTTLRDFVANNSEFQFEAAREARALLAQQSKGFYRDLVKTWAIELLVGLANSTSTERDWAREQLTEVGLYEKLNLITMSLTKVQEEIQKGEYRLSDHAVKRMIQKSIERDEVIKAICAIYNNEIIEEYPDDKYSPICLVYGKTEKGRDLHFQVSLPPKVVIVTTYQPDPKEWIDCKIRRPK